MYCGFFGSELEDDIVLKQLKAQPKDMILFEEFLAVSLQAAMDVLEKQF